MSKKVFATGRISEGGNLEISLERKRDQLRELAGPVLVEIRKETRRLRQNALYWVWNDIVGKEQGEWPDDIHELNKYNCNPKIISEIDLNTGEIVEKRIGASTANLSVDAFAEFMFRVQAYWAGKGISLEGSDEYYARIEKEMAA